MKGEHTVRSGPWVMVVVALLCGSTMAHAAPDAGSSASDDSAPAARAKPRVLVLDLERNNVDEGTAQVLLAALVEAMASRPEIEVISSRDLNQLADLEAERQALGCDTSSCLAELAGAMGARYVVFGAVTKLDDLYVANLNLFDAERAEPVRRESLRAEAARQLIERAPDAALALLSPLALPIPPSSSSVSPSAAPDEAEGSLLFPLGLGTAVVGVLVVLVGGALAASAIGIQQTPSSERASKDLAAVLLPVGAVGLGVGVVTAAAGGGLAMWAGLE